jgi:hypothetical protein
MLKTFEGKSYDVQAFITYISTHTYYGPEVDSVSNRNEYQEPSWG